MDSVCSLFNYPLEIILIAFADTCVSIIVLVAEAISFYWILIMGYFFEQVVMWRQFVSFKGFLNRERRSHHLQVLISLSSIMSDVDYIIILVNTKTSMPVLDRAC